MESFGEWLQQELNQRGWSHRELARRAKMSQAVVSRIVSGHTSPTCGFCIGIAAPLEVSPVHIMQLAGVLPEDTKLSDGVDDTVIQEIVKVLRTLSPFYRDEILRHARYLTQFEQKE